MGKLVHNSLGIQIYTFKRLFDERFSVLHLFHKTVKQHVKDAINSEKGVKGRKGILENSLNLFVIRLFFTFTVDIRNILPIVVQFSLCGLQELENEPSNRRFPTTAFTD